MILGEELPHDKQANLSQLGIPIYAPPSCAPPWLFFPLTPLPRALLEPLSSKLLHWPARIPQMSSLDLAVSNFPIQTRQCLAPSLQGATRTSSSKRKAPLTRSLPSSIGKEAVPRTRTMTLRLRGSLRNLVSRAHLNTAAALARGGEQEGNRSWSQPGDRLQTRRGRMEEVGGENWRKNMGVWNWRTRAVLPETILLLVCAIVPYLLLVSLATVIIVLFILSRYNFTDLHSPERTFLAWLRTSLAFASIGIAVTQLFRLNTTISEREGYTPTNPDNTYRLRQVGKPLGATFLGIAILVLLVGSRRYFESQVCQRHGWKRSSYNICMLI